MAKSMAGVETLDLRGGRLCLDFANTINGRNEQDPYEFLASYNDLIIWGEHAGVLTQQEVERLDSEAAAHPKEAAETFMRAISLRETLYRIFATVADGKRPAQRDLAAFNGELAEAMQHARVYPVDGRFVWGWANDAERLDGLLWSVVRSAAELLATSDELRWVRECPGDHCDWLFLDTSKNHSRRWCSMETCGNVAKARRHYQRQKPHAAAK